MAVMAVVFAACGGTKAPVTVVGSWIMLSTANPEKYKASNWKRMEKHLPLICTHWYTKNGSNKAISFT